MNWRHDPAPSGYYILLIFFLPRDTTMNSTRLHHFFLVVLAAAASLLAVSLLLENEAKPMVRRRLLSLDPRSVLQKEDYQPEAPTKVYNLPDNEWCKPPQFPPLDYSDCNTRGLFNAVPLHGGLTNGLKFVLLSAIKSIEDNGNCFFIDEANSMFPKQFGPFLENYFEPIGLPATSEAVSAAVKERRVTPLPWEVVWIDENKRRIENTIHSIEKLGYDHVEGHDLKRDMLRRLWRPLPQVRDASCSKLEGYIQGEEYLALSIRQGDKATEGFAFATMPEYIDQVEEVVPTHFGGKVPLIFVATDDCGPLRELKNMRPDWRIVSECDRVDQHGFVVQDHAKWSKSDLDEHYGKFFVELFAMAGAKVWIGVAYSNVSWVSFVQPVSSCLRCLSRFISHSLFLLVGLLYEAKDRAEDVLPIGHKGLRC